MSASVPGRIGVSFTHGPPWIRQGRASAGVRLVSVPKAINVPPRRSIMAAIRPRPLSCCSMVRRADAPSDPPINERADAGIPPRSVRMMSVSPCLMARTAASAASRACEAASVLLAETVQPSMVAAQMACWLRGAVMSTVMSDARITSARRGCDG